MLFPVLLPSYSYSSLAINGREDIEDSKAHVGSLRTKMWGGGQRWNIGLFPSNAMGYTNHLVQADAQSKQKGNNCQTKCFII